MTPPRTSVGMNELLGGAITFVSAEGVNLLERGAPGRHVAATDVGNVAVSGSRVDSPFG